MRFGARIQRARRGPAPERGAWSFLQASMRVLGCLVGLAWWPCRWSLVRCGRYLSIPHWPGSPLAVLFVLFGKGQGKPQRSPAALPPPPSGRGRGSKRRFKERNRAKIAKKVHLIAKKVHLIAKKVHLLKPALRWQNPAVHNPQVTFFLQPLKGLPPAVLAVLASRWGSTSWPRCRRSTGGSVQGLALATNAGGCCRPAAASAPVRTKHRRD